MNLITKIPVLCALFIDFLIFSQDRATSLKDGIATHGISTGTEWNNPLSWVIGTLLLILILALLARGGTRD